MQHDVKCRYSSWTPHFPLGIRVDIAKIKEINNMEIYASQREVRIFLDHARYYQHFIELVSKIALLVFRLLAKQVEFY